jgi:hypothetical protein
MKDFVTALTEAVRLARVELACYRGQHRRGTAEYSIRRLDELLNSRQVNEAMAAFAQASPSIVPELAEQPGQSRKHH